MTTAILETLQGEKVTLKGVNVNAEINDLISNVTMTQTYKNEENTNIEAVYTFPLPVDAVLLDLTVTLGEKTLKGLVIEKKQAEEQYEEAITDGDTAIMLQQPQPGTLTMNIGNILADEIIQIRLTYGMLHSYQNNSLRFMLPTTIAPRYGNPFQAGFEPQQTPEQTLSSDYGFNLNVVVKGLLVKADINSPTHKVLIQSTNNQVNIGLTKEVTAMDRDFVLTFNNINTIATSDKTAQIEKDHTGYVSLASFHCDFDYAEDTSAHSIKIVVDCSASMAGDSITQAKKALARIIDSLRDGDFINIIKFGSHFELFAENQECVNKHTREQLKKYIQRIDADMGGTEMAQALKATYSIPPKRSISADVLLITDGEVWHEAELLKNAKSSRHRIFTIGVGSSVAENIVRGLASTTGGACELVSPNETMADKIHRHFKRMYAPQAKQVTILSSTEPSRSFPGKIKSVYAGDTLHIFNWFEQIPEGSIELAITLADGKRLVEKCDYSKSVTDSHDYFLARMASANLLRHEINNQADYDEQTKIKLAVDYQLMTPWTNYLVTHVRTADEKPEDLPEFRKIPNTLAAGWGGTGTVLAAPAGMSKTHGADFSSDSDYVGAMVNSMELDTNIKPQVLRKKRGNYDKAEKTSIQDSEVQQVQSPIQNNYSNNTSVTHNNINDYLNAKLTEFEFNQLVQFINNLNQKLLVTDKQAIASLSLIDLQRSGFPDSFLAIVQSLIDSGYTESNTVLTTIHSLITSNYRKYFDRLVVRKVIWVYKQTLGDKTAANKAAVE